MITRRLPPLVLRWIRAARGRSAQVLPDGRVRLREGTRTIVLPSTLAAVDVLGELPQLH
jgi:hypothetical protein